MAKLVGTFFHSHGGITSMPGEIWRERRVGRPIREDVPIEDDEANIAKANRTHEGFRILREKIAELQVDALVIFSDDQLECFDFSNYPPFAIYVGDEFRKNPSQRREGPLMGRHSEPGTVFKGQPDLAISLLTGVMKRGFDPAFCMDMPKPERGLANGVIRTLEELTDYPNMPSVPIMMNLYFAPQPTGRRCYQFGKAVREVIDEFPDDLRIGVVASGGLWHTPGMPGAWLNVEFDKQMLAYLEAGDIRGMAEHFDSYVIPADDASQDVTQRGRRATGMPMPGGPALGTRETCAWIAAGAVADGRPNVIIDYIDVWASPVGNAFAYCDQI